MKSKMGVILSEADRNMQPRPESLPKTVFEVYRAADGWRVRIQAENGEIIGSVGAEAYTRKADAKKAAWEFIKRIDRGHILVCFLDENGNRILK